MRTLLFMILCLAAATSFGQHARHRVVIEVDVPGTKAYGVILNNAQNLIKAFAPQQVDIEVVCLGEGLDMLLLDRKPTAAQLKKVHALGVAFAACGNTMRGRHIAKNRLYPFVRVVDSGVAEVVRKQEAGWSYLKGAY